ncbi:MAG: hypothetical protein HC898_11650 [Phycisphaerales bacterium]|nr:hypothetical protein [Phycisphaerales bacterium]
MHNKTYPTLLDAQNGVIPAPPVGWTDNITLIASIICQNTIIPADQITEIRDERPRIGFKPSGLAVITNHGDLTGLLADDHHSISLSTVRAP